jgi:tetratricopeptide (TPR) repeat protein
MDPRTVEPARGLAAARKPALLALLCGALFVPAARPQARDVSALVEFRDGHEPQVNGGDSAYEYRAWQPGEKSPVLKRLRGARAVAPGVFERVNACRSLRLFRVRTLGVADMAAVGVENALLVPDSYLALKTSPAAEEVVVHELVHLADPFHRLAWGKEWVALVNPRLARVQEWFLCQNGISVQQLYRKADRRLVEGLEKAAKAEGFPSVYASSSPQEALAEITTAMLTDRRYMPPAEIKEYVREALLSVPHKPDPATPAMHRAADAMARGAEEEAFRALDEVVKADPFFVEAYAYRSQLWQRRKDLGRAIAELGPAVRLTADFEPRWLERRGRLYTQTGELGRAIEDFTAALRLDPSSPEVLTLRGSCRAAVGEYDRAIRDLDEALRLDPKSAPALAFRGMAWARKKRYDKAIEYFDEATRFDPGYHPAYNGRAWLRATCPEARFRDGRKAVTDARRACELTGWKNPMYLDTLAAACAELGDFAAIWSGDPGMLGMPAAGRPDPRG